MRNKHDWTDVQVVRPAYRDKTDIADILDAWWAYVEIECTPPPACDLCARIFTTADIDDATVVTAKLPGSKGTRPSSFCVCRECADTNSDDALIEKLVAYLKKEGDALIKDFIANTKQKGAKGRIVLNVVCSRVVEVSDRAIFYVRRKGDVRRFNEIVERRARARGAESTPNLVVGLQETLQKGNAR